MIFIKTIYAARELKSMHPTIKIVHRYAVLDLDGTEITDEDPSIVTEHFHVISQDQTHDHHFTNAVQRLLYRWMFQPYKSQHCLCDVSLV